MMIKYQGIYRASGDERFDFSPGLHSTPQEAIEVAMRFAFGAQYEYGVREIKVEEE